MADVPDTALYVMAGAYIVPKLGDLVMSFFKGSVSRNIEAADAAQKKAVADLESLKHQIEATDRKLERLESTYGHHKEAMAGALGQIEGRLTALDTRIASQGAKYEEKIDEGFKKLEIELNRKLAQVVGELDGRGRRPRQR